MNFEELSKQYRGTTLPKLIENQIKSLSEETLVQAIRGTYEHFPLEFRPQVDAYTMNYLKSWFSPHILTADLGEVFNTTVTDIKDMATQTGASLNDEQVFDMFNIMVMRLSHFAHSKPELRNMLGIKRDGSHEMGNIVVMLAAATFAPSPNRAIDWNCAKSGAGHLLFR